METHVYFALIFGGMLLGIEGERLRAKWARAEWRARKRRQSGHPRLWLRPVPAPSSRTPDITDATVQLKLVMNASFERRRVLSATEVKVLYALEDAVRRSGKDWRVMAQVNLGEILKTSDAAAFGAINSKRVDLLLVCGKGLPIAAFEYQGEGHYQGAAPARDAVKKEALRKAGVRYIEVTPEHGPADVAREVARMAAVEQLRKVG